MQADAHSHPAQTEAGQDVAKGDGQVEGDRTAKIMAMEGRELDAAVAAALGDEVFWIHNDPRRRFEPTDGRSGIWTESVPTYHSSLDAVRPVVEKCIEGDDGLTYCRALSAVVQSRMEVGQNLTVQMLRAEPHEVCRAILLTHEVEPLVSLQEEVE